MAETLSNFCVKTPGCQTRVGSSPSKSWLGMIQLSASCSACHLHCNGVKRKPDPHSVWNSPWKHHSTTREVV